jgi:hypothetical protein
MTRQEEIGACITTLQNRIPVKANSMLEYWKNDTALKHDCKHLIEDLEDLLGYLKELEELK